METLKEIVGNNNMAIMMHVCNCKAYYKIDTINHSYQLEINLNDSEWKDVYVLPSYKAVTLMRWIRQAIENNDDRLIVLK